MTDFFNTYGALIISMFFASMLALTVYFPLMAGQLSLASPAFYAFGGYVAAVMSTRLLPVERGMISIWYVLLEMLLAGLASAVLAVLVGLPALRLRGIYLALATIGFVEIVRILSLNLEITGGAIGIFGIPQPFRTHLEYLWIAAPLLLLCMFFAHRLERTRVGQAFAAIREDELAANAMGISLTYNKVLAFVMGAVLAGVVGALGAHFLNTWNARQGTFDASIAFLAFVVIGGSRTYLGAVVGGMALTVLPELLRAVAGIGGLPDWLALFLREGRLILYGLLIALGAIFFPHGLVRPDLLDRRPAAGPPPPRAVAGAGQEVAK